MNMDYVVMKYLKKNQKKKKTMVVMISILKKVSVTKLKHVLQMQVVQPKTLYSDLPYYGMIVMISIFSLKNQFQSKHCIMEIKYLQHLVVNLMLIVTLEVVNLKLLSKM